MTKNIVDDVLYFREPSERIRGLDKLKWAKELYSPSILLNDFIDSPDAEKLVDASIKISPLYKLNALE